MLIIYIFCSIKSINNTDVYTSMKKEWHGSVFISGIHKLHLNIIYFVDVAVSFSVRDYEYASYILINREIKSTGKE